MNKKEVIKAFNNKLKRMQKTILWSYPDNKDCESIIELIKNNEFKKAKHQMESLDTFVREVVPIRIYEWVCKKCERPIKRNNRIYKR